MNDFLTRALVLAKTRGRCFYCGAALNSRLEVAMGKEDWHIDRIVPASRGGSDGLDNLVASCAECNRSKGNLTAEEFIRRAPHLSIS